MNWEKFCISFKVNKEGRLFYANTKDRCVLQCVFEKGILDFSLYYDFKEEKPLHLIGKVDLGDSVKIRILPYRIELFVNEMLMDEEWPCGNHYLAESTLADKDCPVCIYEEEKNDDEKVPSVLGSFQNAEGWKPEEAVFVGDCMPYSHEGNYHVLYLKDRHHHLSKWGLGAHQWAHISTEDFVNWKMHPMAVEIDDPKEGSICTGSWIEEGDKQYLFYTVRMCDASPATICRSVSLDGFHFEKDRSFSFSLSEKYIAASARDPKVIKDENGLFHMFLTSTLRKEKNGCLVHLTSRDLNEWEECEKPIYMSTKSERDLEGKNAHYNETEPECPDYFYKDGFYYLVYSLLGKAYYLYSTKPFEDWQVPDQPVIPCKSVPKAAIWNDRLIFTGFDGQGKYAGTMTFLEAVVQEDGQLTYKEFKI